MPVESPAIWRNGLRIAASGTCQTLSSISNLRAKSSGRADTLLLEPERIKRQIKTDASCTPEQSLTCSTDAPGPLSYLDPICLNCSNDGLWDGRGRSAPPRSGPRRSAGVSRKICVYSFNFHVTTLLGTQKRSALSILEATTALSHNISLLPTILSCRWSRICASG